MNTVWHFNNGGPALSQLLGSPAPATERSRGLKKKAVNTYQKGRDRTKPQREKEKAPGLPSFSNRGGQRRWGLGRLAPRAIRGRKALFASSTRGESVLRPRYNLGPQQG